MSDLKNFLLIKLKLDKKTSCCCIANEWPLLQCLNRVPGVTHEDLHSFCFLCNLWMEEYAFSENVHISDLKNQYYSMKFKVRTGGSLQSKHIHSAPRPNWGSLCQRSYNLCQQACWPLSRYFTGPLGIFMSLLNNGENLPTSLWNITLLLIEHPGNRA